MERENSKRSQTTTILMAAATCSPPDTETMGSFRVMNKSSCTSSTPVTMEGLFYALPVDLQCYIFRFFDAKEIASSLCLVCRHWYELATQETLWKRRVKKEFAPLLRLFPSSLAKPSDTRWRDWFVFLVHDSQSFCRQRSAPLLKIPAKWKGFVVHCRQKEQEITFPFPPAHKLALGRHPLLEAKYNYFEFYIQAIAASKPGIQANQIGVGIATAGAKLNEFLGQNTNGGGYYNTGRIGYGGQFVQTFKNGPMHQKMHEDGYPIFNGERAWPTPTLPPALPSPSPSPSSSLRKSDSNQYTNSGQQTSPRQNDQTSISNHQYTESEMAMESMDEHEEDETTHEYLRQFGAGDVVGVLVDLRGKKAGRKLGFLLNGEFQGFHYFNLPRGVEFFPAVTLSDYGSAVFINPCMQFLDKISNSSGAVPMTTSNQ